MSLWSLRGVVALVALCGLLTILRADTEPPPDGDPPAVGETSTWDDPRLTEDPRNFVFDPPEEPGGIPYTELEPEEQAAADRTGELAETGQGYAVQQGWSRAAASARERARLRRAKNESGLDDADVLGVK